MGNKPTQYPIKALELHIFFETLAADQLYIGNMMYLLYLEIMENGGKKGDFINQEGSNISSFLYL